MDLLPRVNGMDRYASDQKPGSGAFARKRRQQHGDGQGQAEDAAGAGVSADPGVDPLLAELDRLRAMDPTLTESGAHRALLAVRAYQQEPADIPALPADPPPAPTADAASSEPTR